MYWNCVGPIRVLPEQRTLVNGTDSEWHLCFVANRPLLVGRSVVVPLMCLFFGEAAMGPELKTMAVWKQFAHATGGFVARILLTLIYAVVILPFGLMFRPLSDSLSTKRRPRTWLDYPPESNEMKRARDEG